MARFIGIIFFPVLLLLLVENGRSVESASSYLLGHGSYDITGPSSNVNMMGYANMDQIASGVHYMLQARAFIVVEPHENMIAFVNLDAYMASQLLTIKVLKRFKTRGLDCAKSISDDEWWRSRGCEK